MRQCSHWMGKPTFKQPQNNPEKTCIQLIGETAEMATAAITYKFRDQIVKNRLDYAC